MKLQVKRWSNEICDADDMWRDTRQNCDQYEYACLTTTIFRLAIEATDQQTCTARVLARSGSTYVYNFNKRKYGQNKIFHGGKAEYHRDTRKAPK